MKGSDADDLAEIFDSFHTVIILDSDTTTSKQVENACIDLFAFSPIDAHYLAVQVNRRGEAPAIVLRAPLAAKALDDLNCRNVEARLAPRD